MQNCPNLSSRYSTGFAQNLPFIHFKLTTKCCFLNFEVWKAPGVHSRSFLSGSLSVVFVFGEIILMQFVQRQGLFGKSWPLLAKWPCSHTKSVALRFCWKKTIESNLTIGQFRPWELQPKLVGFHQLWSPLRWNNISLFIPFSRFSSVNPNILTKICGLNFFLFDNLSFRYAVLLPHLNFFPIFIWQKPGNFSFDLIPDIL